MFYLQIKEKIIGMDYVKSWHDLKQNETQERMVVE